MIKIGDQVRYLNAVGGGKVVKWVNKEIILVEEEDGFETPVLAKECVVILAANDAKVTEGPLVETQSTNLPNQNNSKEKKSIPAPIIETKDGDSINLALAFLADDLKQLSNTVYEAYLVNDSNYTLFFVYSNKEDSGWNIRFAGQLEPNTQVMIDRFEKTDLNKLENLHIQYLPFKSHKPFEQKSCASFDLRLDTVKFYKLHTFTTNPYFRENAWLIPLIKDDKPCRNIEITAEEIRMAMIEKRQNEKVPQKENEKSSRPKILEIDLHINELLDSTVGMSNKEILEHQIEIVQKTMKENFRSKGLKIVFIHGKGDGVLRKQIVDYLRKHYGKCPVQDASFKEYGFGATQVTIA